MKGTRSRLLLLGGSLAAFAYTAYRKEINAANARIDADRQTIDSPHGPIEFGESGNGPAALVIHGAGGGFDQGLDVGRYYLGDDYRIIAPSRFGYLGSPLPSDASPEAQADAHLRVLDALKLERVPVIGISAGAPSALQLALRHPERCSALVLLVPLAYGPQERADRRNRLFLRTLDTLASSDFLFWTATKLAHSTMIRTLLGTPVDVYRQASPAQRKNVDLMLHSILPVSKRYAGIRNETIVANNLARVPLETMRVPTLVISANDCLYGTYAPALYTAENIPGAKFVGFTTGGHLLVGQEDEVRLQITSFVKEHAPAEREELVTF